MVNTGDEGKTIKSLENAFNVIETLRENEPLTLTELSETLPHSKSSVHYYLRTLEQHDWVINGPEGYVLGNRFLHLGGHILTSLPIYRVGRRETEQLAEGTGQRGQLAVARGDTSTIVYQSQDGPDGYGLSVGSNLPLTASAFGKAMMAHLPADDIECILEDHDESHPDGKSRDQLMAEFDTIRQHGLAFEDGVRKVKVRAIAAPVLVESTNQVFGAIGIVGSKSEIDNPYKGAKARRFADDIASQTVQAARNLSEVLEGTIQ